jgi:excisionase family DNA binding protein
MVAPHPNRSPASEAAAPELLTSAEVAELLRVHPKQVYRLLARGLPARRVGGGWRFVRDDVLAWATSAGTAGALLPPRHADSDMVPRDGGARTSAPPPLVAANGDVAVEILLEHVAAGPAGPIGFVQADRSGALRLLGEGNVLAAGYHGEVTPTHLGARRLTRIHLVRREVGLASRRALRRLADLTRLSLATRPKSAGVRLHLDRALEGAAIEPAKLLRQRPFVSHRDAVCAVLRGECDVALTTSAWAERVGLAFLPLAAESYDLVLGADALGTSATVALCESLQSRELRRALGRIAGYSSRETGAIRFDPPSPS